MQRSLQSAVRQASRAARLGGFHVQQPVAVRLFTTTHSRWATEGKLPKKGNAKSKLLHRINAEIAEEQKAEKDSPNESRLDALKAEGLWSIDDVEGGNNVTLVRTIKDETIRVTFSCQPSSEEDLDDEEPYAADDERLPNEERTANAAGGEEEEVDEEEDDDFDEGVPADITVTVQKPNSPTLVADMMVSPAYVQIEGIRLFESGVPIDFATLKTSDAYEGPMFDMLDPDVQVEFTQYFADRGITSDLHPQILDAKGWKEQREYVRWLEQVRSLLS